MGERAGMCLCIGISKGPFCQVQVGREGDMGEGVFPIYPPAASSKKLGEEYLYVGKKRKQKVE